MKWGIGNRWGYSNTQDTSKIPLKNNINVMFYTKYTHPTIICRGTDGRTDARTDTWKIFTQYSGISSCSLGRTDCDKKIGNFKSK
jgi:hypothetical protein